MDNLRREIDENFRKLGENPYPGRGIVLGKSPEGKLLQFYWIMGRIENSRNRYFTKDYGNVRTQPRDPEKVKDRSLVIYRAMGEVGRRYLVSNGAQTETLLEAAAAGANYQQALRRWAHEPDAPHFTPRISGGIEIEDGGAWGWLSIIRADRFDQSLSMRNFYELPPFSAGYGWCLSTYRGEGTPLPSFLGDPFVVPLKGEGAELVPWIWNRLNEKNRISLALKIIDPETGAAEILLENKYA